MKRVVLLASALLLAAIPVVLGEVTGEGDISPSSPAAGDTAAVTFTKSVTLIVEGTQEGSVHLTITGPVSIDLGSQAYSVDAAVLGDDTDVLTWQWTPMEPGQYTLVFDDTPTQGQETDDQIMVTVTNGELDQENDGEDYFAYGDSITTATDNDLDPSGAESYVMQMRDENDPSALADHSFDGFGQSSQWGLDNYASYFPSSNPNQVILVEFGANDRRADRGNLSAAVTASNLMQLHNQTQAHGQGWVGSSPLWQPDCTEIQEWWLATHHQEQWIEEVHARALRFDVRLLPIWDALDTDPMNGRVDAFNATHTADCIHPDVVGQGLLGAFYWFFLTGQDYQSSWDAQALELSVVASYNQTIITPMRGEWDAQDLWVFDATSEALASWAFGFDESLHVPVLNGHEYRIGSGSDPTEQPTQTQTQSTTATGTGSGGTANAQGGVSGDAACAACGWLVGLLAAAGLVGVVFILRRRPNP